MSRDEVSGSEAADADVVVVGAGGSGMTAAAVAAGAGLKVILIEKAATAGGSTGLSVGSIMAAGGSFQRRAGIVDSPAGHAKDLDDIRRAMGAADDPGLRRLLTENAADSVEFLRSIGINFLAPLPQPPHTKSRLHQVMPTSRAYVAHLEQLCRRRGVELHTGTALTRLLTDGDRVCGLEARTASGPRRFSARRAVILASGDIGGNDVLMRAHLRNWPGGIEVYNPNNTGDGQTAAAAIGAQIVSRPDLGPEVAAAIRFVRPPPFFLQRLPTYSPLTAAMILALKVLPQRLIRPVMLKFLTTALGPDRGVYEQGAILVNRHGERFTDELGTPNLEIPRQPDGMAYIVFDERFARKFSQWPYFISTAPGIAFAFVDDYASARPDLFNKGSSIEDLSRRMHFTSGRLQASVEKANAQRSPERRLQDGPFYALGPLKTWVLIGPVGLRINEHFEVLRADGSVIAGLHAVGHAGQGSLALTGHGHGLGWAFTSGRLAARAIVAQPVR